jgi:hypothetical protein
MGIKLSGKTFVVSIAKDVALAVPVFFLLCLYLSFLVKSICYFFYVVFWDRVSKKKSVDVHL